MNPDLSAFEAPFVWGVSDCCLAVADCLVAMGLPDPMAMYRGRYDSERGAYRMFRLDGGLEGAVNARMHEAGYVMDYPDSFVGLVRTDTGLIACIKAGALWFGKNEDGAQGYEGRHVYLRWGHPWASR